jgi:hypothetical protein
MKSVASTNAASQRCPDKSVGMAEVISTHTNVHDHSSGNIRELPNSSRGAALTTISSAPANAASKPRPQARIVGNGLLQQMTRQVGQQFLMQGIITVEARGLLQVFHERFENGVVRSEEQLLCLRVACQSN